MYKIQKLTTATIAFLLLLSCRGSINTTDSKFFTEDGTCTERILTFDSKPPTNVKFFVEVSGSMNGFLRSNQATKFKNDVWSVITDFVHPDGVVNVFAERNAYARPISVNIFREGMNKGAFVSGSSTNVPNMVSTMLDSIDAKSADVGVLISDMKYDPVDNSAQKALISQYSTDIRNIMMHHHDMAICLIVAKSEYLGKDGNEITTDSPYYYLVAGNPENVVYMRNFIACLLKSKDSFVDEIEWGVDYLAPSVKVGDEDYLTEIEADKSYGDFDDECTITLDIDITNYPWTFENSDSLATHLAINSAEGTEVAINAKKIRYDISYDSYDDGKQLKRTAIAKVPVRIWNMYEDSDAFEITLNCPEVQEPNGRFVRYLGSEDVNDVGKTFSMEGLLGGFYSSMPRFKTPHPVHILVSKK